MQYVLLVCYSQRLLARIVRVRNIMIPPPDGQQLVTSSDYQAKKDTLSESTNRYIVMFKEQPPGIARPQAAQQAVEKTNTIFSNLNISQDSLIHQYKWATQGFAGRFSKEQVEKLRKHPLIDHVAHDHVAKAIQNTHKPKLGKAVVSSSQITPWGISYVNGPLGNTENTAWVLDTGVDLDHPELNVNSYLSTSFVSNKSADDGLGHGTYVAGILAAKHNMQDIVGVAPGATVVSVRVCDDTGDCWVSDVKAGVEYVANKFAAGDVANLSLGWSTDGSDPSVDIPLSDLENSITTAANSGLKFAIAAGNNSTHANNQSPARLNNTNIWTVSAFDNAGDFASFSNYGNPPVDYAGPGVSVPSLHIGGGWGYGFSNGSGDGTSYATPHLAGLLLSAPNYIESDGTVSNDPDGNADPIAVADMPLSASVSGPSAANSGDIVPLTASASHAEGSVSYQWYYRTSPSQSWIEHTSASGSSHNHQFTNPGGFEDQAVKVEITSAGETAQDVHPITILECSRKSVGTNDVKPC